MAKALATGNYSQAGRCSSASPRITCMMRFLRYYCLALLLALAMPLRQMFCADENLLLGGAHAFVVPSSSMRHHYQRSSTSQTHLLGLSEWRQGRAVGPGPGASQAPLLLLPFAPTDLRVVGQSTTIVLKEGRYYDLFQDCIDDHDSVMGMVIMGDDGLWETVALCEISDFDVDAGYRGKVTVSVTLRAVGRARLVELVQMKPIMMGLCLEMVDDDDGNDDEWAIAAEELLGTIDSTAQSLGLESRYKDALELAQRTLVEGSVTMKEDLLDDQAMLLRVAAASWAVFGVCTSAAAPSGMITACLREAMAETSALERLKLGRKALLEMMMYRGSETTSNTSAAETSGDSMMEFG